MASRERRSAEEARRAILEAAAALLAEGGIGAVQVRAVARRVGITDAGINHHFGGRDELLEALLRHGGRELRARIEAVVTGWVTDEADIAALVDALAALYGDGYAELAVALHAAGWRDRGSGILDAVVEALHDRRPSDSVATLDDTRRAVAALHQAIALDPLYGAPFRRSAGMSSAASRRGADQQRWWVETIELRLGLGE